jgi:hypothetical protein
MESPNLDSDHSLTPIIDSDDFSMVSKPRSESRQVSSIQLPISTEDWDLQEVLNELENLDSSEGQVIEQPKPPQLNNMEIINEESSEVDLCS